MDKVEFSAVEAASQISDIWSKLFYCSHWIIDQRTTLEPKDWDKNTGVVMLKDLASAGETLSKFINDAGGSSSLGALANLLMGMIAEFQNFLLAEPEKNSADA